MADKDLPALPPPSSEDVRIANERFEYANRATVAGNYDLAIQMLRASCRLVPGNLAYRQALRKVEKTKYKNKSGSALAPLTTFFSRLGLWSALKAGYMRKVLERGEAILAKNPWDRAVLLAMAEAASQLQLPVVAIWLLQDYREKEPKDVAVNRALAHLLEKEGHFTQAMHLWELIRKALPTDVEAQSKAKQMAVSETIARGNYEDKAAGQVASKAAANAAPAAVPANTKMAAEIEALRERLATNPTNPGPYLQIAVLHTRKRMWDEARAVLEEGLNATGNAPEMRIALAELEIEPLRRNLVKCEEKMAAQPDDEQLVKMKGKLLKKIAAQELEVAKLRVEHQPHDKNLKFDLGVRMFQAGLPEEAIREFQTTRSEPRLHSPSHAYLGQCFKLRQNWELARRNFEEALKTLPINADPEQKKELLYELATGHAGAGEVERAVELALDLADVDYGYRDIGKLLEEWQGRQGKGSPSAKRS